MKLIGIIPSRYGSSRFPGKPLVDIKGKTLIQRVYEQASGSGSLAGVVVATDDVRILDHVISFGGDALMTTSGHRNGTERCLEALIKKGEQGFDGVINIQGDEPFIDPADIDSVAKVLIRHSADIATLAARITSGSEIPDPNTVKVVTGNDGLALYFSRSPVPYLRNREQAEWAGAGLHLKHIGIYGYSSKVLKIIAKLPPSKLEEAESLEQLRWLENGFNIRVALTENPIFGIDHPDDLLKITNTP